MGRLDDVDLSLAIDRAAEDKRLPKLQRRLLELRLQAGGKLGDGRLGPAMCVLFEGWDASGKGGAIGRLVAALDPRHVRVVQFAAPSPDERRHHFLHRFTPSLPGLGGMAVFDRTWYGRVLVERVEGFATRPEWQRAYEQIAELERGFVAEGGVLVKLWLHLSSKEQLRRFRERERDPVKQWKLTDDDWRNRRARKAYVAAVEEMLSRTDLPEAPWSLIAAESKHYARIAVVEAVIAAYEAGLRAHGIKPIAPTSS